MRILFDINHPAHAHFFKNAINRLTDDGQEIKIAASSKECVTDLLDSEGWEFELIDQPHEGSIFSLAKRLIRHNRKLIAIARGFKPDVITAVGGTFAAHTGRILGIPSVVFYDTGEAKLQNAITYPFATRVVVPDCYDTWVPRNKTYRYQGCHELAYLAPDVFRPEKEKARAAGWQPGQKTIIFRLVSWTANHDIGLKGLDSSLVYQLVEHLTKTLSAKVVISSEDKLPDSLEPYRFKAPPKYMHDLMAFASLYIGESATMASESAVLGTNAILVGPGSRCYTRWIDREYALIKHLPTPSAATVIAGVQEYLSKPRFHSGSQSSSISDQSDDVNKVIISHLENAHKWNKPRKAHK